MSAKILGFGALCILVSGIAGCGDDSSSGSDAGRDGSTLPAQDSGASSKQDAGHDSGTANDADSGGGSDGSVTMKIPAGGGTVSIVGGSGKPISFDFPASAAGKTVTLTPGKAQDLGWDKGAFSDVIRLEPDGTTFSTPVIVKPGTKDVLLLTLPTSSTQSAPEGLALNATGDGFELNHFSTLVVVAPDASCGTKSGWTHHPESDARCTIDGYPQWLAYSCDGNPFCKTVTAYCCAPSDASACALDFNGLNVNYGPLAGTATPPSYCSEGSGSDGGAN